MDDENSNASRRMSSRTRKVAPKMAAALGSSENRTQVLFFSFNYLSICFSVKYWKLISGFL